MYTFVYEDLHKLRVVQIGLLKVKGSIRSVVCTGAILGMQIKKIMR